MNISHHISQLLYRYPCVTLPGFGAFLTETVSASIQESNHTFYPPKKVISFNSYIKNNDGLLANHISVAEKISYTDAVLVIENVVKALNATLEVGEVSILKNIGLLRKNSEGNIVFEASSQVNYLTNSFGLSSYVSPIVKREELKKVIEEIVVAEKPTIELLPETRKAKPYLKYAAMFIMSLGGAGFGYSAYVSQQAEIETNIVRNEVQKELKTKIQEATFFIDNPVASSSTSTIEEKKTLPFHIVFGSFRSESNAQKALNELEAQGYKARILSKNGEDLYPVVYGSYATYTEAQYEATQIQTTKDKNAWLLIQEL
ncbi:MULTISPECIES: SPOR domain-containing protein [Flavobacterium]|uniref:SPOR domain-containing protein n=1 Tax=Flavobacterium hankyongi TaxID=1176532 RepID=A0ABP8ZNS5_9FLAO|nr:SPOR domain-containing protein [Flavobacterium sp. N1846]